jgi:small nuclear ribonucleoprotein (snRNP)-like protein
MSSSNRGKKSENMEIRSKRSKSGNDKRRRKSGGKDSGKSRRRHKRTFLSIVLNAVRGRELIVELKNNTQYRGVVDICENSMNVVMRDVIRRKPTPLSMVMNLPVPETREEMVYIPSKRIRYVHLPQDFQGSKKEVAKFYELLRFCRKAYQAQSRK